MYLLGIKFLLIVILIDNSKGISLFLHVKTKSSLVTLNNVIFDGYSGNAIYTKGISSGSYEPHWVTVTNSVFQNLNLEKATPFITLRASEPDLDSLSLTVIDSRFENITVKNSLLFCDYGFGFSGDNLTMIDIRKNTTNLPDTTSEDLEYEADSGICFSGIYTSIQIILTRSRFINIHSDCITFVDPTFLVVELTDFNNSGLDYKALELSDSQIDDSYGVTWISISGGSYELSFRNNTFAENKIRPKFGGVIIYLCFLFISKRL